MGILSVDLSNINLDVNFDENVPEAIIHVRPTVWHNIFKQCISFKNEKSKECLQHGIQQDDGICGCQKTRKKKSFLIDKKKYKITGIFTGTRLKKCPIKLLIIMLVN